MNEIGSTNVPVDVQQKVSDFVGWLDEHYEIDQGSTAMYFFICHTISQLIKEKK